MTQRADARNDRIATRYMFGETARTLSSVYGVGETRIHQILAGHLNYSRKQFYRAFGEWPDDLACNAVRPRLLHLMNQFRVRTGLAPFSPAVLMTITASPASAKKDTQPKREKASVCSQSDARGRQDVEGAAKRLDGPERRATPRELA